MALSPRPRTDGVHQTVPPMLMDECEIADVPPTLQTLPADVHLHIITEFDADDLWAFMRTCSAFAKQWAEAQDRLRRQCAEQGEALQRLTQSVTFSDDKILMALQSTTGACIRDSDCRFLMYSLEKGLCQTPDRLRINHPHLCSAATASSIVAACGAQCEMYYHLNASLAARTFTPHTRCTDADAIFIAASLPAVAQSLQHIVVTNHEIGGPGGLAIARSLAAAHESTRSLCTLNLQRNRLDDVAGIALAEALQHTPELKYLLLQDNRLGDATLGALASQLAAPLAVTPWLKHLALTTNPFTHTGEALLREACAPRCDRACDMRKHARLHLAARAAREEESPPVGLHGKRTSHRRRKERPPRPDHHHRLYDTAVLY